MKKICLGLLLLAVTFTLTACVCKHEETKLVDVRASACKVEGYTGDTFCVECGEKLHDGELIPALNHVAGERVNRREATCIDNGYTGDIFCNICNELIQQGELLDTLPHVEGELQNVVDATCYSTGYTGDTYCVVCNSLVTTGETIPMIAHTLSDPYDVIEASCIKEGYSGTRNCTVCSAKVRGSKIALTDHAYVENVCSVCEWRVPGLYINDRLELTWNQLINDGYIKEEDNMLTYVAPALYGTLVIREGVVLMKKSYGLTYAAPTIRENSKLNEVYFPKSCTYIPSMYFLKNTNLERVWIYGTNVEIENIAFENCTSLKSVNIKGSIKTIGGSAFEGCEALEEFTIPASVESIGAYAFKNCKLWKEIELPEGLKKLGSCAFVGTEITELIAPSSLSYIGYMADGGYYAPKSKLQKVDLSKTSIKETETVSFKYCTDLVYVKLPVTLEVISSYTFLMECSNLRILVLPKNVKTIDYYHANWQSNKSLKTIVWPFSLKDASRLWECPNLETIYYEGSEFQWTMVNGYEKFKNVKVVFNYKGDGSEFFPE